MRTGLLAKKIGMTRVFNEQRAHNGVTVLEIPKTTVLGKKIIGKDGYNALILGAEEVSAKKLNKAQKEYFIKLNMEPKNKIREYKVSEDNFVDSGVNLNASHFVVGQFVDVKANSIGKGFAGAMKRHNFAGLRASHGVSISHRSHGSTGNSQDPGRVWKGKKMAGQLGNKKITIQSLEIVSIDIERGLVLVKGGVPGSIGSWVIISDAKKKSLPAGVPFPAGVENTNTTSENKNNPDKIIDSVKKDQKSENNITKVEEKESKDLSKVVAEKAEKKEIKEDENNEKVKNQDDKKVASPSSTDNKST